MIYNLLFNTEIAYIYLLDNVWCFSI